MWFYDRWEIYVEYDNNNIGTYGYADDPGNIQYAIVANDPGRTGDEFDTSQELDDNGNVIEGGTAFWVTQFTTVMPDGRPPLAEARLIVTPSDPADPFGRYTTQFEIAFQVLNFLENDVEPFPEDIVDIGPELNDGTGIGFDVTMMDRDGDAATMITAQGEGAWLGWSSGSKNDHPELDGNMFFSAEFFTPVNVTSWEIY